MSTRGSLGFYCKGESKLTYNHCDSYPSGLGTAFIEDAKSIARNYTPAELEVVFNQIEMQQERDYDISLHDIIEKKSMYDSTSFIKDSLFCEWAYIINIDDWCVEIYKGFQKEPQVNRYAIQEPVDGYYSCAVVERIPMEQIDNVLVLNQDEDGNLTVEYNHDYEYLRNEENATLYEYFNIEADKLTEDKRLQLINILSGLIKEINDSEETEKSYGFVGGIIKNFISILK